MDSFDDMFALSDEELPITKPKGNPMEEHLTRQFSDIQTRIEKTTSDIKEVQSTTNFILKNLQSQAFYGDVITSDSDSDLYTLEGEPVVKEKNKRSCKSKQVLIVHNNWKRIIQDKWIIGINLQNTSTDTLYELRAYVSVKGLNEVRGSSTFWHVTNGRIWYRTDTIRPNELVVVTIVLDLPAFRKDPFCDTIGTISYRFDEELYQTPLPMIRLLVEDIMDDSFQLRFSVDVEESVLALKCTSTEKIVAIQIEEYPGRGESLLNFLSEKAFQEICADVYVAGRTECLMYCLIEILPIVDGETRLRIFSRSSTQMNLLLKLLRDQFSDAIVEEDNYCLKAAKALLEELQLYLNDASSYEKQMARIRTDLLIS